MTKIFEPIIGDLIYDGYYVGVILSVFDGNPFTKVPYRVYWTNECVSSVSLFEVEQCRKKYLRSIKNAEI
mgnify:CR=1 FL=1